MIEKTVFNQSKTIAEYRDTPLLLGPEPGLFDTVNKKFPKVWSLYKEMKSLDWDENEFDYSQCLIDFQNCPKTMSNMMIRTLAWQWEADSVASRSLAAVMAPFISSSELWAATSRVADNEVIHAATYSEIVRLSFPEPKRVLEEILAVKESLQRMKTVEKVFNMAKVAGAQYTLGMIPNNQELYNIAYTTYATLLMLERIQFMASFAITFMICGTGLFQPIGNAVKKICQDELEVHVELDKAVLEIEGKTERGRIAKEQCKELISKIFHEIIECERSWLFDYMFANGENLIGSTPEMLYNWVLFNAKDPARFLKIESDLDFPKKNPMPILENWIDMNKQQAAPQEQDAPAYKVGAVLDDSNGMTFDVDF